MNILIISHQVDRSGAPTSLLNIIKHLSKKGHTINTISMRGGELAADYNHYSSSFTILNKNQKETLPQKILSFFKLIKIVRNFNPDVVLINTSVTLRAHLACYLLRKPFVIYVRESEQMLKSKLGYFRKKSLTLANKIISVSEYATTWIKKYVDDNKIVVIHNGIDINNIPKLPPKNNNIKKRIGIIGYIGYRKGIDYFLSIATHLLKNREDVEFVIIGDIPNPNEKKLFLEHLAANDIDIEITGIIDDVYPEINKCDLILMTSREESLPRSVMEATLLRKPVVAFDTAGTKEMLPRDYQYLIQKFNTIKFIEQVNKILNSSNWENIGLSNHQFLLKHFNIKNKINKLESVLYYTSLR